MEIIDEKYLKIYEYVLHGNPDDARLEVQRVIRGNILSAEEILKGALIPALKEVGFLFERGEFFVPEMLLGAKAMKAGMEVISPFLAQSGKEPVGKIVLLTVNGDIHDIGKDLVKVMLEGSGFEVIDLGVDVSPETIVDAVNDNRPDIVGFSAFLTTTIPMFEINIKALRKAGLRDQVMIMVGGSPVTQDFARKIGADVYAPDASSASRYALDFMVNKDRSPYLLQPLEVKKVTETREEEQKTQTDLFQVRTIDRSKPSMSPRERVIAVLNHQQPDRVPHFEWAHDKQMVELVSNGQGYYDFIESLDIDGVIVSPSYRRENLGNGMIIDEWQSVRRIGKDNYAIPVDDQSPLKTITDLENWNPPDPDDPYRYENIIGAVKRFGGDRAIILQMRDVWSGPRDYLGYVNVFIQLKECPELVEGVVKKCISHYIRIIQRAAEIGVDIVFTGDDIADNRGPMFSPKIWESLFLPHYKYLVKAIHEAGLYHWKHSDGNMYPFLDSIIESGSDGIDPIDPLGGMELSVVKAKYGDRVAIKGNVDQTQLLMHGKPEEVVEAVKTCIRDAGIGGGYVCSSSNTIHSGVDPVLYKVMVEAIHHYGQYPLDL